MPTNTKDPRRWGVIETRFRPGPPAIYQLTIGGQLWAAVEWSTTRGAWCIEDAAGHCLAHCEHIHGQDIDQPTALALAKAMIRDGRVPPPEEARRQLEEREEAKGQSRVSQALTIAEGPDTEPDIGHEEERRVPWTMLADPVSR